jgi:hypothetical protein
VEYNVNPKLKIKERNFKMLTTVNYSYDKLNKLCSVVRNSTQAEHLRGTIRDSALSKSITREEQKQLLSILKDRRMM